MKTRIKLLIFGALAALGMMSVVTSSAVAAPGDDLATCHFHGTASPLLPAVQSSGGTGTYSFQAGYTPTTPAYCSVVDGMMEGGDDGTAVTGPGTGTYPIKIDSAGTYSNVICGTGTADGNSGGTTVKSGDPLNPIYEGPYSNINYHIDFTGGHGKMYISSVTNGDTVNTETGAGTNTNAGNGGPDGIIQIVPTPVTGGDCVNGVSSFDVNGHFDVTVPETSP